jgi:hypothetical protein
MTDLGKLLLPRTQPRVAHTEARATVEGGLPTTGVAGATPMLDPVADAVAQLAVINAYFAVVAAGGSPTASQYAAAQAALGALGSDLRSLQLQPEPPPGSKIWVSGAAAAGLAGAAGLVGGVVGWLAHGAKSK